MNEQNEIVLYQPNELTKLEVRVADETVWLSQQQMAELFGVNRQAITKHLKNIYDSHELRQEATCSILELVQSEGNRLVKREVGFYNLDAIISVGFRVNTIRGIQFRQWANSILKDYMLRGYAVNQRLLHIELEALVKTAKQRAIIIDGYVDALTFDILDVRAKGVKAEIYTNGVGSGMRRLIETHDKEVNKEHIDVYKWKNESHDRWLIIDDTLYHCGHSLNAMGKHLSAISQMGINPEDILNQVR